MSGSNSDVITIVSGLPRSGTSMMMRMIDAGGIPALTDRQRVADEDNPLGYYEYEAVKKTKEDASWLDGAIGQVVKMVHLLLYDLPLDREYRVVFMRRELGEMIRSQNAMLVRHGKPTDNLDESRLKEIFEVQLTEAELFLQKHDCFAALVVSYNDVINDVATEACRVNQFLCGDLDVQAMIDTVDTTLYRQRRRV